MPKEKKTKIVLDTSRLLSDEKEKLWKQMNSDGMISAWNKLGNCIFGGNGNIEWMYEATKTPKPELLLDLQEKYTHVLDNGYKITVDLKKLSEEEKEKLWKQMNSDGMISTWNMLGNFE